MKVAIFKETPKYKYINLIISQKHVIKYEFTTNLPKHQIVMNCHESVGHL